MEVVLLSTLARLSQIVFQNIAAIEQCAAPAAVAGVQLQQFILHIQARYQTRFPHYTVHGHRCLKCA